MAEGLDRGIRFAVRLACRGFRDVGYELVAPSQEEVGDFGDWQTNLLEFRPKFPRLCVAVVGGIAGLNTLRRDPTAQEREHILRRARETNGAAVIAIVQTTSDGRLLTEAHNFVT